MEFETTSILDDKGGLEDDDWLWGGATRVFFMGVLSLVTGLEFFFLEYA